MSYFIFYCYFYVSFIGLITSDGEGRANFSAIVYLEICGLCG